ncbi:MAG TPA: zinc metalloprotease [Streptosporangiaceae bacterium]
MKSGRSPKSVRSMKSGLLPLLGALTVLSASASAAPPPATTRAARSTRLCAAGAYGSAARVRAGVPAVRDPDTLSPGAAAADRLLDRVVAERTGRTRQPGRTGRTGGAARAARHGRAGSIRVPVDVHVVHAGRAGNVPVARIRRQIAVLNATFGGRLGGADTGFRFALRRIDRTDNAAWYHHPERHERAMKSRLHLGGARTLNLYTADLGEQLLGWSTFPWRYHGRAALDGVVVHVDALPGGSIPHYSRGLSATHEVGHWLGLFHTFQDGCAKPGDRVADTPPEREPGQGCPAGGRDTCPSPGKDPIHNFMDYSYDTCMTEFTTGQSERMRAAWAAFRS